MISYFENHSLLNRIYVNFLRENSFVRNSQVNFIQYRLMKIFLKRGWPYCWLREGDSVIQVGCTEWMMGFGVSQALIMSVVVGKHGRVIVIEPDSRNVQHLRSHISKYGITNIKIIQKGVWNERSTQEFIFYDDRTSTNVLSVGQERIFAEGAPESYKLRSTQKSMIEVDSLDNIIAGEGVFPALINITINGTEFEAIQGLGKNLNRDIVVSFPIWGPRSWFPQAFKELAGKGYDILVADAPYSRRAPSLKGKATFWSQRTMPQHLYACARRKNRKYGTPIRSRLFEASFKRTKSDEISISPVSR